jgi:hypothetical protein
MSDTQVVPPKMTPTVYDIKALHDEADDLQRRGIYELAAKLRRTADFLQPLISGERERGNANYSGREPGAIHSLTRPAAAPTPREPTPLEQFVPATNGLLWECPDCAFAFDAMHKDEDGGYSCPVCEVARLTRERRTLEPLLVDVARLTRERDAAMQGQKILGEQLVKVCDNSDGDEAMIEHLESQLAGYREVVEREVVTLNTLALECSRRIESQILEATARLRASLPPTPTGDPK